MGRLISSRGTGEKATQYSYDENNRLTRWVYTIPTLSRTAMHYTYNTDTTDTIPDGLLTGVTMFDSDSIRCNCNSFSSIPSILSTKNLHPLW